MGQRVFLIYGAGAMGSLIGGLLSRFYSTYLVARKQHADEISEKGLVMEGLTTGTFKPRAVTDLDALGKVLAKDQNRITHCLVFTKSYDTREALREISRRKEIIRENVILISLQNGMDNEKIFLDMMPSNPIIGGYTCHGVIHDLPGHIVHSGEGFTVIGPYENISAAQVAEFGQCLVSIGITPTIKNDIRQWIFKKVITNAAINPLTAILDIPNGELLERAETQELMKRVVAEGVEIAKEMDMDISPVMVLEMVKDVASKTRENLSSMLQDIRKGNRTEIDCINGSIVRLAREYGLKAPVNETLTKLIKVKQGRR